MKKLIRLLFVALALAGCTKVADQAAAPPGSSPLSATRQKNSYTVAHTLRIGDVQDITSPNPHLATAFSLGNMSTLTMAYLVRYGADNRPVPELATIVPSKKNHLISPDGRTIVWHLRRGVRWSDGAPFDADDLVFSTNVVNNVHNNEVGRDGFDLIAKIDEPDKFTVIYHLKRPFSGFLPTFFGSAGANPCVLPRHILSGLANINNAPYNSKPIGIGPFRYVRWVRNDRVEMEANPYYWRGMPKLKKIVYKFVPDRNTLFTQIQTGEVDLWPLVGLGYYDRIKGLTNVKTIHHPGYIYGHLDFNLAHPIFADKAVREALRFGIDRSALRDKLQHGLGILQDGSISPASPYYTALPRIPFDLAKANAVLDGDGWKRGPDGVRVKNGKRLAFNFATTTGAQDADQQIELIRSTWQQLGVQINVEHYASTLMFAPMQDGGIIYSGKFDMISFAWQVTPDGDLSTSHGCAQMPPDGQNDLHYCDPKTQALLDAAKAAYDEDERRPILAAAQRQIIADVPEIVLSIREDIYTYNTDLTGWKPNATTPFDSMLNVDI